MAMPATERRWTVAEVLALPDDGKRYELIAGELLVSPAPMPPHQALVMRLIERLAPYLRETGGRGRLWTAPADLTLDDDSLVQPDLFVVPAAEVSGDWRTFRTLWLVIEVLSASTSRRDRGVKRQHYQRHGVREYWIVDGDARTVEVWRPGDDRPAIVSELLRWRVADAAPEVVIELKELFANLPG